MSNDNGGLTVGNALDCSLNDGLRFRVKGTCWLVEEKDTRVSDNGSCKSDTLLLAAGELSTTVTNL